MKKQVLLLGIVILSLNFVMAINLQITESPSSQAIVTDLDRVSVLNLHVKNYEDAGTFEIYSLVGLEISPENFYVGEERDLEIRVGLRDSLKSQNGLRSFEYSIKNSAGEVHKEMLTFDLKTIEDSFSFKSEAINPKSEILELEIRSLVDISFDDAKFSISSAFFDYSEELSFSVFEKKNIEIPLRENIGLSAGNYIGVVKIEIDGVEKSKEFLINFVGQEDIQTIDEKEGFIIIRNEILKKNLGNVDKDVEIVKVKSIVEYLFTTFNEKPSEVKFNGLTVSYVWKKRLIPGEEFKVVLKTNWFFPIIVLVLIVVFVYLIRKNIYSNLILTKKVSFVKTKGGQFALKVSLKLKAKTFIQKIKVVDKIPHLVKLYNKFGVIEPDEIDLKNRRLVWNVDSLNKDEERVFTYIIYSKVGVVGRFELPSAHAVYEKDGKIKESESNRSFFINDSEGV